MLIAAALVEPGDEVLVGDPSYPCNRRFVEAFGGSARLVATDAATRFQLTPALVEASWGRADARPDDREPVEPERHVGAARRARGDLSGGGRARGGWRLVDEIYLGLSHDAAPRSVLAADPGAIAVGSFSKHFAMTGWRLGWAIVPEVMVEAVERLAQNLYICPSTPAQHAALECFHPETLALCESRRETLAVRRDTVLDALATAGWQVPVAPDGAFYVYLDTRDTAIASGPLAERILAEAHVALTPGLDFGEVGAADHLRLSYAASTSELERAAEALGRFRKTLG